jgi:hypothetical protein
MPTAGKKIFTPTICSLSKFQRCGAFIAPLPIKKDDDQKKFTAPLGVDSQFLCQSLYDVKQKPEISAPLTLIKTFQINLDGQYLEQNQDKFSRYYL